MCIKHDYADNAKDSTILGTGGYHFMALINCPECGKEISDKVSSCIHCGGPLQASIPIVSAAQRNNKPQKRKFKVGCFSITVIIVFVVIVLNISNQNNSNDGKRTTIVQTEKPIVQARERTFSTVRPSPTPEVVDLEDLEDLTYQIHKVLVFHRDKANKSLNEGEEWGAWNAFKLNAGLYKISDGATSFKHRAYYYAVYGEEEYLKEFGYNEKFKTDVKEYVDSIPVN